MRNFARACVFTCLAAVTALAQIALPSLSDWTEIHTNALINAQTADDLNDAADSFLAENISIVVNGVNVSRSEFLQTLVVNLPGRVSSNVSYTAIIEDPFNATNPIAVCGHLLNKAISANPCGIVGWLGRRLLGVQQLLLQQKFY